MFENIQIYTSQSELDLLRLILILKLFLILFILRLEVYA